MIVSSSGVKHFLKEKKKSSKTSKQSHAYTNEWILAFVTNHPCSSNEPVKFKEAGEQIKVRLQKQCKVSSRTEDSLAKTIFNHEVLIMQCS